MKDLIARARPGRMRSRLKIKIREGTRSDGKRLCDTCRHATVMKGAADSAEVIHCGQVGEFLHFKVVDCNDYDDKAAVSLHALGKIAWVLETDKSGRKIGFTSPDRWRSAHKHENPTDEIDDF